MHHSPSETNRKWRQLALAAVAIGVLGLVWLFGSHPLTAQEVQARLSTREAYVGMPVVLQVQIRNAGDYEAPSPPEIDGCDVRASGAPMQSSQLTIINGRRSESRSVTIQYLITPNREGQFEVPPLDVEIDGKTRQTRPLKFVATKSETGDLLFVEIRGGKEKVYVGEPLELTLRIWIKPFRDRQNGITLSEANMWQMVSEQTSWGSFSDRLRELVESNQRPGGREVLRDDGQGRESRYYLYEIEATVYPVRPGKIAADDVRLVVNYPTAVGKSRDPFDAFFDNSPFGSGRSPFGRRLSVKSVRPIVAEAKVDSTEVLPVPVAGRPADYRGAVGRYHIVAQATPENVTAGDPITLNIGIIGDGPMELVQAPPLATLPALVADFKTADQPLAGFVQNNTKLFSTTIRPRREGLTQIPPIPFSFFDPASESFRTVYSEPLPITVSRAETLALDSIVGGGRRDSAGRDDDASPAAPAGPDLDNHTTRSALISQAPAAPVPWWPLLVVPPLVWLVAFVTRYRGFLSRYLPGFRSARSRCLSRIARATDHRDFVEALVQLVSARFKASRETPPAAIGALRTAGLSSLANDLEAFFSQCQRAGAGSIPTGSLEEARQVASTYVERLENSLATSGKHQVKRRRRVRARNRALKSSARAGLLLLALSPIWMAASAAAGELQQAPDSSRFDLSTETVSLTKSQQQTVFDEANRLYAEAREHAHSDSAEALDGFRAAASRYQLLVDSGVRNSRLYTNLGNAWLQCGELGRALASYERASRRDPFDPQIISNLKFSRSQVQGPDGNPASTSGTGGRFSWSAMVGQVRSVNTLVVHAVGLSTVILAMVLAWLAFWTAAVVRAWGYRFPFWKLAAFPLLVLATALASVSLERSLTDADSPGIVVANQLTLRAGDGQQFAALHTFDSMQGQTVEVLAERAGWVQVETASGEVGWVRADLVEQISQP